MILCDAECISLDTFVISFCFLLFRRVWIIKQK